MLPSTTKTRHMVLGSAIALIAAGTLFTGCAIQSETRPGDDAPTAPAASPEETIDANADPMPTSPALDFESGTIETYVARVVDARTIVVTSNGFLDADPGTDDETTIVLAGLEVPRGDECGADEATDGLEALLPAGNVAIVNTDATHPEDENGHEIARVTNGGLEDIGETQIANGFATVDLDSRAPAIGDYAEAQKKASDENEGLWATCLTQVIG